MRGNGSTPCRSPRAGRRVQRCEHGNGSSARSGKSLVPTKLSLRRATLALALGAHLGDGASGSIRTRARWRCRRRARSPGTASRRLRKAASVSASMAPEPAAGSATRWMLASSMRMVCVLRAMRRANASGTPSAALNGSTVMASAPPTAARERGDGAAHDVPVRIALGHHAPRRLGGDEGRLGLEPASVLDPRPELPEGAELGDGEELVLVGGETEDR